MSGKATPENMCRTVLFPLFGGDGEPEPNLHEQESFVFEIIISLPCFYVVPLNIERFASHRVDT